MIGLDSCGAIVLREKVSRGSITSRLANLPPCHNRLFNHLVARESSKGGAST